MCVQDSVVEFTEICLCALNPLQNLEECRINVILSDWLCPVCLIQRQLLCPLSPCASCCPPTMRSCSMSLWRNSSSKKEDFVLVYPSSCCSNPLMILAFNILNETQLEILGRMPALLFLQGWWCIVTKSNIKVFWAYDYAEVIYSFEIHY